MSSPRTSQSRYQGETNFCFQKDNFGTTCRKRLEGIGTGSKEIHEETMAVTQITMGSGLNHRPVARRGTRGQKQRSSFHRRRALSCPSSQPDIASQMPSPLPLLFPTFFSHVRFFFPHCGRLFLPPLYK